MSIIERWKGLFGKSEAPKKTVHVGESFEELTHTQAYRFNELSEASGKHRLKENDNPFDRAKYSLGDAAFRLMTSEADVLRRAASGEMHLFVSTNGTIGRWRYLSPDGSSTESSETELTGGHLALPVGTCQGLVSAESVEASVLHFPKTTNAALLEFDAKTQALLSTSGGRSVDFLLTTPLRVARDQILLMAPLETQNH